MTDIVERLRAYGPSLQCSGEMDEAADEIERLNISHKELIIEREIKNEQIANMRAEIERLQAALDDECAAHKVCVEMRDRAIAAKNIHKGAELSTSNNGGA